MFAIITGLDGSNRVARARTGVETRAAAEELQAQIVERWPGAFVAEQPAEGLPEHWIADPVAETLVYAPPPAPSDAERAALVRLRRAAFFVALDAALGLTAADPLPEEYVVAVIAASALSDAQKRLATILLRSAGEFLRQDPDAPGLLDAVGAALGLTPGDIDAMFLAAAEG